MRPPRRGRRRRAGTGSEGPGIVKNFVLKRCTSGVRRCQQPLSCVRNASRRRAMLAFTHSRYSARGPRGNSREDAVGSFSHVASLPPASSRLPRSWSPVDLGSESDLSPAGARAGQSGSRYRHRHGVAPRSIEATTSRSFLPIPPLSIPRRTWARRSAARHVDYARREPFNDHVSPDDRTPRDARLLFLDSKEMTESKYGAMIRFLNAET